MSLRRSTRAASVKPATKTPAKAAAASKPPARKTNPPKRPASPENAPPPAPKRARGSSKAADTSVPVAAPHANGKAKPAAVPVKRTSSKKSVDTPPFNPLPVPPEHTRPAPQVFVWGAGNFGQFGMGVDALGEFDKPRKNAFIKAKMEEGVYGGPGAGFETIAAGGLHTLFIDEVGTVWSCGVNDDAALGRITQDVPDPENEGQFIDIDTLTSEPHPLQSLKDENFRAVRIATGDTISAAINAEGDLRVWGSFRGVEGTLGFSSDQKCQFLPIPILSLKAPEKFTAVAAGNNHLIVLTTAGSLYTWGAGEQGQLGRKVLERRKIHGTVPERIVLGSRTRKAVLVGAGNYTSFAVDDHGDVWGWGLNNMGQTGTGKGEVLLPRKVLGLSKEELGGETVTQIVGGEHHTIFLTSDGKVYACGRSNGGQLGLEEDDPAFEQQQEQEKEDGKEEEDEETKGMLVRPAHVTFPDEDDPVVQISAGIHNNLAVTKGGALYTWGSGPQGELGAGDETEVRTPKMIVRKTGGSWAAVAAWCGGQHSIALLREKS